MLRPCGIGIPKGSRTPVTAVKGRCPRPLDDGDIGTGAGNRVRTGDLNLGKVALYQLSYSRSGIPKGSRTPVTAVKGRCPRPLDDGDPETFSALLTPFP